MVYMTCRWDGSSSILNLNLPWEVTQKESDSSSLCWVVSIGLSSSSTTLGRATFAVAWAGKCEL